MFYFLCKSVLHGRHTVKVLSICQNHPCRTLRFISSSSNEKSFTVSYLQNKCGLSSESALTASKHVHFETPEKPDSVIALFKNYGFTESQITRLIKKRPVILASDAEKTLLSKLGFFRSKGVSSLDLAKIISDTPTIMSLSLENRIIPLFNFLRNVLKSDEKIIQAVRRRPRLLGYNPNAVLLPNINILLDNGVPECNIATTLYSMPSTLIRSPIRFKGMVEEAKEMGFNPFRPMFMVALFAMASMSKPTWKRKFVVFEKFGWSEEEVIEAFRRYPTFVRVSEDKLVAKMDFLVNEMGFQSLHIAKHPRILLMSLEKKIVPRGLFLLDMLSKGVIKRINIRTFETSDSLFIEKFVNCYKAELLNLYQEKLDLSFIEKFVNCYKAKLLNLYEKKLDLSKKWKMGREEHIQKLLSC